MLGFPHTRHPSYGALALTPAGLTFLLNMLAFIGHTEKTDTTRCRSKSALKSSISESFRLQSRDADLPQLFQ